MIRSDSSGIQMNVKSFFKKDYFLVKILIEHTFYVLKSLTRNQMCH